MITSINRRREMGGARVIEFADAEVKRICVEQWGGKDGGIAAASTRLDGVYVKGIEGEMTYRQAAAVKSIPTGVFTGNTKITLFDELQYFTGLCEIESGVVYKVLGERNSPSTSVFSNCTSLVRVTVPSNITIIGGACFKNCTSLRGIGDISNVRTLWESSLGGCRSLTDIDFSQVTGIGYAGCTNCKALTSIDLSSMGYIGKNIFSYCTGLVSVTLGSPTGIAQIAFAGCMALKTMTIAATTPPTLGSDAIPSNAGLAIYVPDGSVEAYKAADGWSSYASKIFPMSDIGGGIS